MIGRTALQFAAIQRQVPEVGACLQNGGNVYWLMKRRQAERLQGFGSEFRQHGEQSAVE